MFIVGNEVQDDVKQLSNDKGLILIATPGRLKDIMERQQGKLSFRELEVLILDEADVLLVVVDKNCYVGFGTRSYNQLYPLKASKAASNRSL